MRWGGIGNGALVELAAAHGFDVLISTDRGLEYEQNQATLPLPVIVLRAKDNKLRTLESLLPALIQALQSSSLQRFLKIEATDQLKDDS